MSASETSPCVCQRLQPDQYHRMGASPSSNGMIVTRRRQRTPSLILLRDDYAVSRQVNGDHSTYHPHHAAPEYHTEGILLLLLRWIRSACFVFLLGILSIVTYHLLYTLFIVPSPNIVQDLYFDYSQRYTVDAHSDSTLIPIAVVDLYMAPPFWDMDDCAVVDDSTVVQPPPSSRHRKKMKPLKPMQSYSIDIQLLLPDSPVNQYSSMFTVQTELYSTAIRSNSTPPNRSRDAEVDAIITNSLDSISNRNTSNNTFADVNKTLNSTYFTADHQPREWVMLAQSRRSYRFPFHSLWITTLYNLIHIIPILWNYYYFDASAISWESQWIFGTSFAHYVEKRSVPLVRGLRSEK
jgi:Putative adipose-regulatory protein (Seipin)